MTKQTSKKYINLRAKFSFLSCTQIFNNSFTDLEKNCTAMNHKENDCTVVSSFVHIYNIPDAKTGEV